MKIYSYGDQVIENAVQEAAGWMKTGEAAKAVNSAIDALRKVAEYLAEADFAGMKPEVAARTGAYLAKMVDEIARLVEFSQGKPDSRPAIGLGDLLPVLTDEQFKQLSQWIDEAKTAGRLVQ